MAACASRVNRRAEAARRRLIRRRRLLATVVLFAAVAAMLVIVRELTPASRAVVELRLDGQAVGRVRVRDGDGRRPSLDRLVAKVPGAATVHLGAASVAVRIARVRTAQRILSSGAGTVTVASRPLAASIRAPVVAQRLRNNCETAALSVLLATTGVRVDQLTLQREVARSGPLDPRQTPAGLVWGDPDRGFVGRADGSGPWGGFGVYPRPIASLAERHGRQLRNLSDSPASLLYRQLLAGHAVLAWVALGDGPYRSWRSPTGRQVRVNLNEHTIVLTGIRADGTLDVINVLYGTREQWSQSRFERAFALLGRRALATT